MPVTISNIPDELPSVSRPKINTNFGNLKSAVETLQGDLSNLQNSVAVPPFRAGPGPALPDGMLIRGANIVPNDQSWSELFINWPAQWTSWIKPQLDLMKANGINTVRLISGICTISDGTVTRTQFLSYYRQFVEYCGEIGLYVYATCGDSLYLAGTTRAAVDNLKPEVMEMISMLNPYPQVIAIDMWNEFFNAQEPVNIGLNTAARHVIAADWCASARLLTNIPLTWSEPCDTHSNGSNVMWADTANLAIALTYCDFIDRHAYYNVQVNDPAAYVAACGGVPLLMGEVGFNINNSQTSRATSYAAISAVIVANNFCGCVTWAAVDQFSAGFLGGHPEWNFGMFDHALAPYASVVAAINTWPISQAEKVFATNKTFYGSASGSDYNTGLSSSSPKTAQGACDMVKGALIKEGVRITIQLLDGTYAVSLRLPVYRGLGLAVLNGNSTTRTAVVLAASGSNAVTLLTGGVGQYSWLVQNVRVTNGNNYGALIQCIGGTLFIGNNVTLGAQLTTSYHLQAAAGTLTFDTTCANLYIEGGAQAFLYSQSGAQWSIFSNFTLHCTGANNFSSAFAYADLLSIGVGFFTMTVSGGTVTGKRYICDHASFIRLYGGQTETAFPGNASGSDLNGGLLIHD